MEIGENVRRIKENIARAAMESGRRGEDICLVAATKMNSADAVRQAICAGVDACGENRVQELTEKDAQGAYEGASLHFIGHLQKNKVKYVVGAAQLIHSVDSLALMEAIDREAAKKGVIQDVLLEVNIGAEESKSGFAPDEIGAAIDKAAGFPHIFVRGLMAIPPKCGAGEENIPFFLKMKQLFVDNRVKKYDNVRMDFMSMGMSGDYEAAIRCGANMVRIGSAIFGERIYPERK